MIRFEMRLEPWQHELLKAQSQKERMSMAALVRRKVVGDQLDLARKLLEYGERYLKPNGQINYTRVARTSFAKQAFPDCPSFHARMQLVRQHIVIAQNITEEEEKAIDSRKLTWKALCITHNVGN